MMNINDYWSENNKQPILKLMAVKLIFWLLTDK